MNKAKIIVVSGVTAGGKTTLINELSKQMLNSSTISFDDYDIDMLPSAPPLEYFLEEPKKAINQYDISQLMNDLLRIIYKYEFILLDFPFGYEHKVLFPYIDVAIYVKTPLDVVFARQIIRDYSDKTIEEILEWSNTYLSYARPIFLAHEKIVSSTVDYILDGELSTEKQVEKLFESIII